MIELIFILISHNAYSQDKMQYSDISATVSEKCVATNSAMAREFESRNKVSFKEAASYELSKRKDVTFKTQESLNEFCISMLGKVYGKVRFTSSPSGAKIYIENDSKPLSKLTNANFAAEPGEYHYKIEINQNKKCEGNFKIEKNNLTTVQNCKG